VKVLCELVTVNRERDAIEPLSDWEGGIAVRICKSGDLPAEDSGSVPVSEYQSSGRNRYADPGATSNWSQMSEIYTASLRPLIRCLSRFRRAFLYFIRTACDVQKGGTI